MKPLQLDYATPTPPRVHSSNVDCKRRRVFAQYGVVLLGLILMDELTPWSGWEKAVLGSALWLFTELVVRIIRKEEDTRLEERG